MFLKHVCLWYLCDDFNIVAVTFIVISQSVVENNTAICWGLEWVWHTSPSRNCNTNFFLPTSLPATLFIALLHGVYLRQRCSRVKKEVLIFWRDWNAEMACVQWSWLWLWTGKSLLPLDFFIYLMNVIMCVPRIHSLPLVFVVLHISDKSHVQTVVCHKYSKM